MLAFLVDIFGEGTSAYEIIYEHSCDCEIDTDGEGESRITERDRHKVQRALAGMRRIFKELGDKGMEKRT